MDIGQEVYHWAAETMALTDIEHMAGWGAAWMCHLYGRFADGDAVLDILAMFGQISSDDPSFEAAEKGHANMLGVLTGVDWPTAVEIFDGPAPHEAIARLQHYFWGGVTFASAPTEVTGIELSDAVDKAVERFYQGLGWAAEIGATNYEASLHQVMGSTLVRSGRLADAIDAARVAEELADSLGMTVTRDLSRLHQIIAALLGEEVDRDPFALLVETLESTLQTGHRGVASPLVKVAARYLANSGHFETAALCMLQPDLGFHDILPDLGIGAIPEDVWESARDLTSTIRTLDIAERALADLRTLDKPTTPRQ